MPRCLRAFVISLGLCTSLAASATNLPVAADAHVNSSRPTTNFGYMSNLYVGNGSTTLLQFNLAGLPTGLTASQVARATVTVFVSRINSPGDITISPVTSSWTESGVTYSNLPTIGTALGSVTPGVAGTYVMFDVTSLLQSWITTPSTNFGIALNSASGNILLDSKENDQTGHAAALDVSITSVGATGATGATGPQGAQGIQGIQGIAGAAGLQGATGVTGPIGLTGATGATGASGAGLNYKSTWSSSTTYAVNDAVSYNGSSYVATTSNQNVAPATDPTVWTVLAQAGPTGVTGPQGIQGAIGATGAAGVQGTTGVAGAVGATGAIGATGATGPTGATGATGATGSQGMLWIGTYSNTTTYNSGNVVSLNGTSYIARQTSLLGVNPATDSGTNWSVVAQVGATGPTGPQGAAGFTGNTGPTGATGPTGPTGAIGATGANGNGLASAWVSSTAYTASTMVTYNNSLYVALANNSNVVPDSAAASGVWAGVALGSGNSPAGIPYAIGNHDLKTGAVGYFSPNSNGASSATINTSSIVIAPTSCTPSMTIYSYTSVVTTFTLYSVTLSTDLDTGFIQGGAIMSCTVGSSAGGNPQTCSMTSGSTVAAGTVMTLSAPPPSSNNAAFFSAFSCY